MPERDSTIDHMPFSAPVVSIVTPTHNAEATLAATLASVQGQSFSQWEHILVDDASQDRTPDLLAAYCARESRARWIRFDQNQGAAAARNAAIDGAQGRYIAFLDSDDLWLPGKLKLQLAFMREKDVAFSFTGYDKIDEDGAFLGQVRVPPRQRYHDLLKNNTIGCLTAMYDTKKLGKVMMPSIRKRQDLGLWLRLLKLTPHAYGMPDILAQYRIRPNSISANKLSAAKYTWRLYREVEQMSALKAGYYFLNYALNGVVKTYFIKYVGKKRP